MRSFLIGFAVLSFNVFAQEKETESARENLRTLSLQQICQGKNDYENSFKVTLLDHQDLIIMDNGFCTEFLAQQLEIKEDTKRVQELSVPSDDRWKVRLYMSHSFTTYFDTDVTFRSTRYNVLIKDYSWAERSSREFFNPKTWKEEGNNPAQILDEPTNTFTASIEKNGNEFFIQAFHPKFLQASDQVKYMQGTIDDTWVEGFCPVNKPFDGYDQEPGESELVRNENTHLQMTFEVGYGHRFNLAKGKYGSITYVPSIAVGIMVGQNFTVMIKPDEWWEFDDYIDPYGIQGFGGSITNRLEFNTKKERFGLYYENKFSYYRQNHGFLDGTQKYNLMYMGNSFGMKFMIYNPNKHLKKAVPLF